MEKIIAYHCAPALAGIKPANIVTCYKSKIEDIYNKIESLNKQLNCKDIYIEPLCERDNRILLMVYRKKVLDKVLENAAAREFLEFYGYKEGEESAFYLENLRKRFNNEEMPHEIGVFLGYPLHDIYGFMTHKKEGCILCGEWKVYENAEEAQKLFERFNKCRRAVVKRIAGGKTLAQVFC